VILAVASVVIGWVLNELSAYFRSRRDDRAAIGRALYYLAEVRYSIYSLTGVVDLLGKMFPISEPDLMKLKGAFESLLPNGDDLHRRFEEALDIIANKQPHLAFRLRNKDTVGDFLKQARLMVESNSEDIVVYSRVERTIIEAMLESLDEAILDLAWLHGLRTRWRFGRVVKIWNDATKREAEIKKVLDGLLAEAQL